MNIYLIISIIEAIYIIYFLRYFKTTKSFDYGKSLKILYNFLNISDNKYLNHQISETKEKISHICPFGHFMALVIGFYLIIRVFLPFSKKKKIYINLIILALIFIGSFLNFNAVIYLIPFFIIEIMLNIYLKKIEN